MKSLLISWLPAVCHQGAITLKMQVELAVIDNIQAILSNQDQRTKFS